MTEDEAFLDKADIAVQQLPSGSFRDLATEALDWVRDEGWDANRLTVEARAVVEEIFTLLEREAK